MEHPEHKPESSASGHMPDTVAIACDHAGYPLKRALKDQFPALLWHDAGTHDPDNSVDYPDFARALCEALGQGVAARGILICGTGIGMSIAANRFLHIRAALCVTPTEARLARAHNNANVLCLGARIVGTALATDCVAAFLEGTYEAGRHDKRVEKLSGISCQERKKSS